MDNKVITYSDFHAVVAHTSVRYDTANGYLQVNATNYDSFIPLSYVDIFKETIILHGAFQLNSGNSI